MIRVEQMFFEFLQKTLYKYVSTEKLKASKFLSWLGMAIVARGLRLEAAIYPDEISIESVNSLIIELKQIIKN